MEAPTINLIGYRSTRKEIFTLYQDVYQLKRAPRVVPCDLETEEEVCREILDSLKECLWHRWGSALPEEEPRQGLSGAKTHRTTAQVVFHARPQDKYDHFWNRWQESHEEALRLAQDAHHQVLVATALLEGHIKRLGHSISHG